VPCTHWYLQRQIAASLGTQHNDITVWYVDACSLILNTPSNFPVLFYSCTHLLIFTFLLLQIQTVSTNCAFIALVFTAVLASGEHPSVYLFHQQAMREHLHICLMTNKFSPFPTRGMGRENKETRTCSTIHVYCNC